MLRLFLVIFSWLVFSFKKVFFFSITNEMEMNEIIRPVFASSSSTKPVIYPCVGHHAVRRIQGWQAAGLQADL